MSTPHGVLSGFPVLNSNVRAAMTALADEGLLGEFHTTLDTTLPASILRRGRLGASLARRALPPSVHRVTRAHPANEAIRLLGERTALRRLHLSTGIESSLRTIDDAIARRLRGRATAVYGYEDAAVSAFTAAERAGLPRIYDLPIAHWRTGEEILDQEAELEPQWAGTLSHRQFVDRRRRQERKDGELQLASRIVTASSFTRDSLLKYPGTLAPISVIPYGAPTPTDVRQARRQGPLRVLFVGGLSQRKGISYFFDAVQSMGHAIDVTVVGLKVGESEARDHALEKVSWIPTAPHARVLELMRDADVLVFPSLFEGFGLVLTEALSQGLPIIATPHTAAPDLITDGVEGWIVPIRSADAIRSRLEILIDDISLARHMGEAALERARRLEWSSYGSAIVHLVREATRTDFVPPAADRLTRGVE